MPRRPLPGDDASSPDDVDTDALLAALRTAEDLDGNIEDLFAQPEAQDATEASVTDLAAFRERRSAGTFVAQLAGAAAALAAAEGEDDGATPDVRLAELSASLDEIARTLAVDDPRRARIIAALEILRPT